MFHIKNNIAASLALVVMFTATAAFAEGEVTNPLTGHVGVDANDESAESIKLRSGSGDPVAGREKSQLCQGCHGEEGISIEGLIPKLAGQYSKYIIKQVRNYQSGKRSHQIMNAMAGTVTTDEDLADIAAYFASRTKMKGNGSADNALGKSIFTTSDMSKMRLACVNCHGVSGKGLTPNTGAFPVLGGQQKDYIRRQLVNFRAGLRTNSPSGIMNKVTQKLTDAEIEALAEYVSVQ